MSIGAHGTANCCDLEDSHMQHMHRGGPEIFSQNIHPIGGKTPACEDLFTRMSVRSKSRRKKADKQPKQPGHEQSIPPWGRGTCEVAAAGEGGRGGEASGRPSTGGEK